jgi:putative endonuclease
VLKYLISAKRGRAKNLLLIKLLPKQEMLFFVYVLGSQRKNDRRTYVGWTTDIERRLQRHNTGLGAKSTRGRKWILLYSERCKTRSAAMSREWYIKRDRAFRATLRGAIRPD